MAVKNYTETAHAAARVNKEAPSGVVVEHKSRETIKVDFSSKGWIPPEVVAKLRENGFALEAAFGASADFKPYGHPRLQA